MQQLTRFEVQMTQCVARSLCDSCACHISFNYQDCPLSIASTTSIFSERTALRSLYAISRPSVVCCLSVVCLSVTLVHPTQAVELFGNFFTIR